MKSVCLGERQCVQMACVMTLCTLLTCGLFSDTTGACFGAVEACFLNPVPGQTTPLIFKAFNIMAKRSVLLGQSLAVFYFVQSVRDCVYLSLCRVSLRDHAASIHVCRYVIRATTHTCMYMFNHG